VCLLFVPAWAHRITRRAWIAIPAGAAVASLFAWVLELANVSFAEPARPRRRGRSPFAGRVLRRDRAAGGWLTAHGRVFAFTAFYYGLA
jgi:hypothetical protein